MSAPMSRPAATEAAPSAETAPPRLRDDWRLHFAAIAVLALVVRLLYLAEIRHWIFFEHPVIDASSQYRWAQQMIHTDLWLGNDAVLSKPPLYTYYLAFNIWLFEVGPRSLFSAHLLQMLLSAATCGLTYLIGRRTFGTAVGLVAGAMMAVFSPGVFNDGELLDTALSTFLTAAFLLSVLLTVEKPTLARWLGAGILMGVLALVRANLLLFVVVTLGLVAWWFRRERGWAAIGSASAVFLAGIALALLPITIRNYVLVHEFVPISTNGGINFLTGNRPDADGFSPIPAGVAWQRSWYLIGRDNFTSKELDDYYRDQGLKFWRQQPGRALALLVKKAYLYWVSYDIPNNVSYDYGRAHSAVLRALPLGFGVVGPLGLLGLALGWRRSRNSRLLALSVAAVMVSVVVFFVCGRYRMPMLPALCAFAALAIVEVVRLARQRQGRALALSVLGLLAFGLFVNSDLYGVARTHGRGANRDYLYLAEASADAGDHAAARDAFAKQTEFDPTDVDAWAYTANMEKFLGQPAAAAEHYRKALAIAPDFADAAVWLVGLTLDQNYPLGDARQRLERALAAQNRTVAGFADLVRLDLRDGDVKQANADLQRTAESLGRWPTSARDYPKQQQVVAALLQEIQGRQLAIPPDLQAAVSSGQSPSGPLPGLQ